MAAQPQLPTRPTSQRFRTWGAEALDLLETDFRRPDGDGYYEDTDHRNIAFMWGNFVVLWAYASAAKVDRERYEPYLEGLLRTCDRYWDPKTNDVGGYDCWPLPKPTDRYYDDNAWMGLGLLRALEATGNEAYLARAREVCRFVLSGEDQRLGGGIWWKETWGRNDRQRHKDTCATAPGALLCLELYGITGDQRYFESGQRLLDWLRGTMQDTDGLFYNDIKEDGSLGKRKFAYNSAIPIICFVRLHQLTGDTVALSRAERIASAAEAQWVDPDTGAIKDAAMFAFILAEAWLDLYDDTGDAHWLAVVRRCLECVHDHGRDPLGRYPGGWDQSPTEPLARSNLLWPASAADAYWQAGLREFSLLQGR